MDSTAILQQIKAGTQQVIPEDALLKKLASGKKLKIKFGADPTAPDLHLGHAVVLSKLKLFQELGHEVIFLIGDFTARIGDPTGRSKTRPPLSEETILQNTATYLAQVGKILDPNKLTVAYNSHWLSKITSTEWIALCARVTLSRIIEREDFSKRLQEQAPIGMHELLYPLLQGYDSVELRADVELGGTDQTFNLLMGRHLQEQFGQEPQTIITTPLLEGLDGVMKMSKSYGNYIGLTESPDQAFGKLMSVSDTLMWRYYQLLLNTTNEQIAAMQQDIASGAAHPMTLKKEMAHKIVQRFWGASAADEGKAAFEHLFQKKDFSHAVDFIFESSTQNPIGIIELIKILTNIESNSEIRRLLSEGAVSIDDQKITDQKALVMLSTTPLHVKIGKKRFYSVTIRH